MFLAFLNPNQIFLYKSDFFNFHFIFFLVLIKIQFWVYSSGLSNITCSHCCWVFVCLFSRIRALVHWESTKRKSYELWLIYGSTHLHISYIYHQCFLFIRVNRRIVFNCSSSKISKFCEKILKYCKYFLALFTELYKLCKKNLIFIKLKIDI